MLKLGKSRAVITPDLSNNTTLDGMGRLGPILGVQDDLHAELFLLQDGKQTVVLCALDQVFISEGHLAHLFPSEGLFPTLNSKVSQRLPGAILILCSTHCHSATVIPKTANEETSAADCVAARNIIYEGVMAALEMALQDMREVEVAADRFPLVPALAGNRRTKLGNGTVIQGWGAGPLIPPGQKCVGKAGPDANWIDLIAFREPGTSRPLALISSYPSHIHFYEIPLVTGEAAGAAKNALHAANPDLQLMYCLGFGGDNAMEFAHPMPKDDEPSRIAWQKEKSVAFGEAFAQAVSARLPALHYSRVEEMQYVSDYKMWEAHGKHMLVECLRLGNYALCSLPGEMFLAYEETLRSDMPCEALLTIGYNRSDLGYVATSLGFEEGGYETIRGPSDIVDYHSPSARAKSDMDSGATVVQIANGQLQKLFCP